MNHLSIRTLQVIALTNLRGRPAIHVEISGKVHVPISQAKPTLGPQVSTARPLPDRFEAASIAELESEHEIEDYPESDFQDDDNEVTATSTWVV